MNEQEFKHHLKDLVHGHHHPEEHDWEKPKTSAEKKPRTSRSGSKKKRA